MSQLFTSGGQSSGASALALILPMNIQDWFPLGWTGWISLLSKGLSRVFSSTTFQKHYFCGAQPSLFRPWAARPGRRTPSGFCPSLLDTHLSSVINKAEVSNMQTLQQGQCQEGRCLPPSPASCLSCSQQIHHSHSICLAHWQPQDSCCQAAF